LQKRFATRSGSLFDPSVAIEIAKRPGLGSVFSIRDSKVHRSVTLRPAPFLSEVGMLKGEKIRQPVPSESPVRLGAREVAVPVKLKFEHEQEHDYEHEQQRIYIS